MSALSLMSRLFKMLHDSTMGVGGCMAGYIALAWGYQLQWGPLPAEMAEVIEIMQIRGMEPARAEGVARKALLRGGFVRRTDETWVSPEFEKERLAAVSEKSVSAAMSEACRIKGRKSAAKRWPEGYVRKWPQKKPKGSNPVSPRSNPVTNVSRTSTTNTLSPSQAQGLPPEAQTTLELVPASHSPRRREPSASHGAQVKRAAKRKSAPRRVAAAPNGSSPHPRGAESVAAAKRAIPAGQKRPPASVFTPQDPRFPVMANEIRSFWDGMNPNTPCPWGNSEKGSLSRLLGAWACGLPELQQCLQHRVLSVLAGEVSASVPPGEWIESLPGFLAGPLNKFGDPLRARRQG